MGNYGKLRSNDPLHQTQQQTSTPAMPPTATSELGQLGNAKLRAISSPVQRPGSFAWQMEVESALNQNLIRSVLAKKNPNLIHQDPSIHQDPLEMTGNPSLIAPECPESVAKTCTHFIILSLSIFAGSVRRTCLYRYASHPHQPMAPWGKTPVIPIRKRNFHE